MSERVAGGRATTLVGSARSLVVGRGDPRVRATWRVLIVGLLFVPPTEAVAVGIPAALGLTGRLPVGITQAAIVAVLLVGWARYVDRRWLSAYGLAAARPWLLEVLVGFLAVLVGFGAWLAIGSTLGWATVRPASAAPIEAVVVASVSLLVAVALNVWVQETVFVGAVGKNAAEGLAARGLAPAMAVGGAWLVAVSLFAWIHGPSALGRIVNLLVVLGVYGLLYVQTGELALSIGAHAGVNYVGGFLVSTPAHGTGPATLVHATTTLSGFPGSLHGGAVPHVLIAYVVLCAWLAFRRGGLGLEVRLAEWVGR